MRLPHNKTHNMDSKRYCVILAGGHGNHFWPVTREDSPKQLIDLDGDGKTYLRMTYERFRKIVPPENILVVTLDRYSSKVRSLLPELPEENLLREPLSRGTGPCMAYAAYVLMSRDPSAVMVVTPSDHSISDEQTFASTVSSALDYAAANQSLVTLGIVPTGPDTHFGYIQVRGGRSADNDDKPLKVKTFTEKPDAELAKVFIASGEFYWNSGIFMCKVSVIVEEMERYIPEVTSLFTGWEQNVGTPDEEAFIQRAYAYCPKVSLDYGVMEKTSRAFLKPARFGWADISDWDTLLQHATLKDSSGNAVSASSRYLLDSVKDSVLISSGTGKLIAARGLEGYVVVDTPDALLICPRDEKSYFDLIAGLGEAGFEEYR